MNKHYSPVHHLYLSNIRVNVMVSRRERGVGDSDDDVTCEGDRGRGVARGGRSGGGYLYV
jgi:hypothetical protein